MLIAKKFVFLYPVGTFCILSDSLMHNKIELDSLLYYSAKQVSLT